MIRALTPEPIPAATPRDSAPQAPAAGFAAILAQAEQPPAAPADKNAPQARGSFEQAMTVAVAVAVPESETVAEEALSRASEPPAGGSSAGATDEEAETAIRRGWRVRLGREGVLQLA